jgi:DNA-binding NtrC family response regulator
MLGDDGIDGGALAGTRVLLVEDTPALARTYLGFMRDEPYEVIHVDTGGAAKARLSEGGIDLVLLDLRLPDISGQEVLGWMRGEELPIPVIVITAQGSVGIAVEAMRAGAVDFLMKPFAEDRLLISIRTHLERRHFAEAVSASAQPETAETTPAPPSRKRAVPPPPVDSDADGYSGFIGKSVPMQGVYRLIASAAKSSATVFVTGESGTGKEVCAQAIHDNSARSKAKFVAINCGAIPGELMESEIFGHIKGAFTGATANKQGAARLADGGTLFLDEICEMPPLLQTKLLRFIQTGTFNPVGQPTAEQVDVRFICATNRDPLEEVAAGRFREDLYYRLHVVPIHLPPLRARGDDMLLIGTHLLQQYAAEEDKPFTGFSDDAKAAIRAYGWPGNVRQLQNILRNGVVLGEGPELTEAMLRAPVGLAEAATPPVQPARRPVAKTEEAGPAAAPNPSDLNALAEAIRPMHEVERATIERAVDLCGGDVRKAAVFLNLSPATIYRKQKQWRVETP